MHDFSLGRRVPEDWRHYERFPLTAETLPTKPVPVVIGIDWYMNFDSPKWDGSRYWVGRGELGHWRGGHCVCIKATQTDSDLWYQYYDQKSDGACVGFGVSRMMSLLNQGRHDAVWAWQQARLIDEWSDNDDLSDRGEGTSVRAGLEILRSRGHRKVRLGIPQPPDLALGIAAYRWTRSVDELIAATGMDIYRQLGAISFLNSWGTSYPRRVWMPGETLQKLLDDGGEAGIVTDR